MADQRNPTDTPLTPRRVVNSSAIVPENAQQAGTSNNESEINRDNYMYQMEEELQELRGIVRELRQQQRQTQNAQTSVPPPEFSQTVPPPLSAPFFQFPQQPVYYPPPPGAYQYSYPYPYPPFSMPASQKKECTYKQFLDCKPPEYHGSMDPTVTWNWIRGVVRALDACDCEERSRVKFATGMLRDEAMVWWESITEGFSKEQIESISWDQFQNTLCEQYCNAFETNKIRQEFLTLQMTEGMTVDELIKQFNLKLRFVKQWVPDEISQVQHFVGALLPEYRSTVRLANSLPQAFTLAKSVESDVRLREKREREKIGNQRQRMESPNSHQRKKWQGSQSQRVVSANEISQRSSWCPRCRAYHSGSCTSQTSRCARCGLVGHEAKDCELPRDVCWNCQQEGHRASECPSARRSGSGVRVRSGTVGGSSSSGQKRKNPPSAESRAFR